MNSNPIKPGKIQTFPIYAIQVCAAVVFALCCRAGALYVAVLGAVVLCATLALQIIISKSYWYFVSVALSLSVSYLIGGFYAFGFCLCAVPTGIVLSVLIRKKQTKVMASLVTACLYGLLFFVLFLVGFALFGNELSISSLTGFFSELFDSVKSAFISYMEPSIEVLCERYGVDAATVYDMFDSQFDYIKLMLPAYAAASFLILGYITACVFKLSAKIAGCELVLPDPRWEILPSSVCAWVYIGAYFVYFFTSFFSPGTGVFELASNSIITLLTPAMLLMGAKWVMTLRNKWGIIVLFIFSLFFIGSLSVYILSFFGVRETLRRRDIMKKREYKN